MTNKSNKIKIQRYESTIKKIITNAISNEIYDELIKKATILDVKLTNDKSIVKIYIDCYDKILLKRIENKMNGAASFFRTVLARELNWRKAPRVTFVIDNSNERYEKVEEIIKSWKEDN